MDEDDASRRDHAEEQLLQALDAEADSAEEGLYSLEEIREAFGLASG